MYFFFLFLSPISLSGAWWCRCECPCTFVTIDQAGFCTHDTTMCIVCRHVLSCSVSIFPIDCSLFSCLHRQRQAAVTRFCLLFNVLLVLCGGILHSVLTSDFFFFFLSPSKLLLCFDPFLRTLTSLRSRHECLLSGHALSQYKNTLDQHCRFHARFSPFLKK